MKNSILRILTALLLVLSMTFSFMSCEDTNSGNPSDDLSDVGSGNQDGNTEEDDESKDDPGLEDGTDDRGEPESPSDDNNTENEDEPSLPGGGSTTEDGDEPDLPDVGDDGEGDGNGEVPGEGDGNGEVPGGDNNAEDKDEDDNSNEDSESGFDFSKIPEYSGSIFCTVNGNVPFFTEEDLVTASYETYGNLDSLGRCTTAMACVGLDIMPTEPRGDIGSVYPTGWVQRSYSVVKGGYLYNRCHLIGFQLTGENANVKNLITGTRDFNNDGMLPFENMIADYIKETGNHVLYRVTPVFEGDDLLARGVLLEAYSVEDNGDAVDGICFNVYAYNVQPGVIIDYATGETRAE